MTTHKMPQEIALELVDAWDDGCAMPDGYMSNNDALKNMVAAAIEARDAEWAAKLEAGNKTAEKICEEWKLYWMDQKQNSKEDYENYLRRAMGVDANMRVHLEGKIAVTLAAALERGRKEKVLALAPSLDVAKTWLKAYEENYKDTGLMGPETLIEQAWRVFRDEIKPVAIVYPEEKYVWESSGTASVSEYAKGWNAHDAEMRRLNGEDR